MIGAASHESDLDATGTGSDGHAASRSARVRWLTIGVVVLAICAIVAGLSIQGLAWRLEGAFEQPEVALVRSSRDAPIAVLVRRCDELELEYVVVRREASVDSVVWEVRSLGRNGRSTTRFEIGSSVPGLKVVRQLTEALDVEKAYSVAIVGRSKDGERHLIGATFTPRTVPVGSVTVKGKRESPADFVSSAC